MDFSKRGSAGTGSARERQGALEDDMWNIVSSNLSVVYNTQCSSHHVPSLMPTTQLHIPSPPSPPATVSLFPRVKNNDITVWSPQGRIHQIEYAMEAVKQGSATVGLKSKTHAVLVALKRAQSELAAHQKKILQVDNHIGISIAGLTADARLLCNFMRQECLDSRFVFDRPLPVSRLVSLIGSKTQIPTQRYGWRPYGVGLLIAGYDDMGLHIFQTCPSANYFDCRAMSIGACSQSAHTYLERHMSGFMECNLNELVKHGLRALRETLPAEQDLTTKNVSIGIVGKDLEFTIYDDDDVSPFLEGLEERPQRKAQPAQPADEPAEKADEPMEH
ncbi:unnamed protein product [Nyctereutes procyonoides]|uniref:Proteasome subunit alpha type-1 n=1 Tax=Nyctereutes procyonoides TaxID=34880 RepID=A0A811YQ89_NYCPR|nr:unnamed protein product [Nyctereutes procyonoides]